MSGIKRAALVFGVVALLLLVDGIYLQVSNNQVNGDTGQFFGNANYTLSPATIVLVSGGLVLLGALLMWAVGVRRDRLTGGPGQIAGPGPVREESGDQR